jgi:hypothetical protein
MGHLADQQSNKGPFTAFLFPAVEHSPTHSTSLRHSRPKTLEEEPRRCMRVLTTSLDNALGLGLTKQYLLKSIPHNCNDLGTRL